MEVIIAFLFQFDKLKFNDVIFIFNFSLSYMICQVAKYVLLQIVRENFYAIIREQFFCQEAHLFRVRT